MERIISTQLPDQFEKLKVLIANQAELLNIPMIRIEPCEVSAEIVEKIKQVVSHNWLIFTSMRGIQNFFGLYDKTGYKRNRLNHLKFACIGKSTNKELNKFGFNAAYINPGNTSKDFSSYLTSKVLSKEDLVFLPLGNKAGDYLPTRLAEFCKVSRVDVYQTKGVETIDKAALNVIKTKDYGLMIITSPSAMENFIKLTAFKPELNNLKIASIGETTNKTIRKFGYEPVLTASKSNLKTLATEIIEFLK